MAQNGESCGIDYENKYILRDDRPLSIRLVQIQPRAEHEHPQESMIVLKMRVVDLDPSQLLPGEDAAPTGRPSVRFDEEMNVERPEEYFGVPKSSLAHRQQQRDPRDQGRIGRLVSKLKGKSGARKIDPTPVPVSSIPDGEPKVRNRFKWGNGGNYVAMSYTWGKMEVWESTAEEKEEAARKHKEQREGQRDPWNRPMPSEVNMEEEVETTYPYTDGEVHEVLLDGQRVRVRYNLWAALLVFREMKPFKDGMWLWNDALCICQFNTDAGRKDRARTIPLMSMIYRQAGNIIIHLGGAYFHNENTPYVFDYLQSIGANYRTEYYEALDHAESTVAHSHRFKAQRELEKSAFEWVEQAMEEIRDSTRQASTDRAMISVYDFFDRPYWRRLWIIQELSMAHHSAPIICGDFVTQWRYIRDGALLLCMMADTIRDAMQRALEGRGRTMKREPSFGHVAAIAELAASGNRIVVPETNQLLPMLRPGIVDVKSHSKHPMLTMAGVRMPLMNTLPGSPIQQSITLAADANCGWDRDRVLGLLAIPALRKRLPLRNDAVFANLPATDIYLKYAQACVKADHSLDIFSLIEGGMTGPDQGRHFPSWCPRFHVKSKIGRIEGEWHAQPTRPKYSPRFDMESADFEGQMAPRFNGEIMSCPGWVIDSVDGLGALSASDMTVLNPGPLFQAGVVMPRFHPEWNAANTDSNFADYLSSEPIAQAIPDQIWRTLVGGTGSHGKRAPSSFSNLLKAFPESWPSNDRFLYKRNWDFVQANRDLPIDGKPLGSYFAFQAMDNFGDWPTDNKAEHGYHKVADAHRAMEARTKLRRLMTTSARPLMGLVPASTQQGDVVIVLWYHSRPLIATVMISDDAPDDSQDLTFKLKGEAFIPGIMEGELANSGELDTMKMTEFKFV